MAVLFFAHPDLIKIYKKNCNILMGNCMCKTSLYRLPIFCLVVVTKIGCVVPIAHRLMLNEKVSNFQWTFEFWKELRTTFAIDNPSAFLPDRDQALMRALKTVMPLQPIMLCTWHINADVKAVAGKYLQRIVLPNGQWTLSLAVEEFMTLYRAYINSTSEEDFNQCFDAIKQHARNDSNVHYLYYDYLAKHWWPYKEKIIKAWTNKIIQYGYDTTSLAESSHFGLKTWLHSSRNDALTSLQKMALYYESHIGRYYAKLGTAQLQVSTKFRNTPLFHKFCRVVTTKGLEHVWAQKTKLKEELDRPRQDATYVRPRCTHTFCATIGALCSHELEPYLLDTNHLLKPDMFDNQYLIPDNDVNAHLAQLDQAEKRVNDFRRRERWQRIATARSHQANTEESNTRRDPTRSERLDPNNCVTSPGEERQALQSITALRPAGPRCSCKATRSGRHCGGNACSCKKRSLRYCKINCHGAGNTCDNMEPLTLTSAADAPESLRQIVEQQQHQINQLLQSQAHQVT